jgi:hypothetical protein
VEGTILRDDVVAVRADVLPHEHHFGDLLTARVDVLLDRAFVDPGSVRMNDNFSPFRVVPGSARRERENLGATTRLRHTFTLHCHRAACLPDLEGRRFELPEVRVSYLLSDLEERSTTRVELPVLLGTSRLGGVNLDQPAFRADPRELPEASYRVSPGVLAAAALALAGLLVLGAVALLAPLVPVGLVQWRLAERRARRRTDLERALEHVRATAPDGRSAEVRPALERLASELGRAESPELAGETRRLAWSEPEPVEDDIGGLSGDVERVITEGRA